MWWCGWKVFDGWIALRAMYFEFFDGEQTMFVNEGLTVFDAHLTKQPLVIVLSERDRERRQMQKEQEREGTGGGKRE